MLNTYMICWILKTKYWGVIWDQHVLGTATCINCILVCFSLHYIYVTYYLRIQLYPLYTRHHPHANMQNIIVGNYVIYLLNYLLNSLFINITVFLFETLFDVCHITKPSGHVGCCSLHKFSVLYHLLSFIIILRHCLWIHPL